jgi:hypothetical protein
MDSTGASERHQNNNLKVILSYVNYLGKDIFLSNIKTCDSILSFLELKKKKDEDPDGKWISTWNHYFHRIKHFFRWYYNCVVNLLLESNLNETKIQQQFYENENQENWKSPDFSI